MKVRVTFMTENSSPAEIIGKTKEERNNIARAAWNLVLPILRTMICDTDEKIELESVEVLDDEKSE